MLAEKKERGVFERGRVDAPTHAMSRVQFLAKYMSNTICAMTSNSQQTLTCSKLTLKILQKSVKNAQS